jgi:hypothetical protein
MKSSEIVVFSMSGGRVPIKREKTVIVSRLIFGLKSPLA